MPPRKLPALDKGIATLPPVTSKYLTRLPAIAGFVGSTGSGKTYLCLSLIHYMLKEGTLNKVYIVSPSASSNTLYASIYDPARDWIFEDIGVKIYQSLKLIEQDLEARAAVYRQQLEYAVAYKMFRSGDMISQAQEWMLEEYGYRQITPVRPKSLLLLDDCQSSAIFRKNKDNPFENLVLKCRHLGEGCGLSIFMVAQSYRSGIPRVLRLNCTAMALFRTESQAELTAIYEEIGAMVSKEKFMDLFDRYTRDRHSYTWIDLYAKKISDSF